MKIVSRRKFVLSLGVLGAAAISAPRLFASSSSIVPGLEESALIYLSPLLGDGTLSRCQAEIWFAYSGGHVFVVTATDAWRAEAVRRGRSKTHIWVGDVGRWNPFFRRHLSLPSYQATASIVDSLDIWDRVLEIMGSKYKSEWSGWGPRFYKGLRDGSRVMLKYKAAVIS